MFSAIFLFTSILIFSVSCMTPVEDALNVEGSSRLLIAIMFFACKIGDVNKLQWAISEGANPSLFLNGDKALDTAVTNGHLNVVEVLMHYKPPAGRRPIDVDSALLKALFTHIPNPKIIKYLLENTPPGGKPVNLDQIGVIAGIYRMSWSHHAESLKVLLDHAHNYKVKSLDPRQDNHYLLSRRLPDLTNDQSVIFIILSSRFYRFEWPRRVKIPQNKISQDTLSTSLIVKYYYESAINEDISRDEEMRGSVKLMIESELNNCQLWFSFDKKAYVLDCTGKKIIGSSITKYFDKLLLQSYEKAKIQ